MRLKQETVNINSFDIFIPKEKKKVYKIKIKASNYFPVKCSIEQKERSTIVNTSSNILLYGNCFPDLLIYLFFISKVSYTYKKHICLKLGSYRLSQYAISIQLSYMLNRLNSVFLLLNQWVRIPSPAAFRINFRAWSNEP